MKKYSVSITLNGHYDCIEAETADDAFVKAFLSLLDDGWVKHGNIDCDIVEIDEGEQDV